MPYQVWITRNTASFTLWIQDFLIPMLQHAFSLCPQYDHCRKIRDNILWARARAPKCCDCFPWSFSSWWAWNVFILSCLGPHLSFSFTSEIWVDFCAASAVTMALWLKIDDNFNYFQIWYKWILLQSQRAHSSCQSPWRTVSPGTERECHPLHFALSEQRPKRVALLAHIVGWTLLTRIQGSLRLIPLSTGGSLLMSYGWASWMCVAFGKGKIKIYAKQTHLWEVCLWVRGQRRATRIASCLQPCWCQGLNSGHRVVGKCLYSNRHLGVPNLSKYILRYFLNVVKYVYLSCIQITGQPITLCWKNLCFLSWRKNIQ